MKLSQLTYLTNLGNINTLMPTPNSSKRDYIVTMVYKTGSEISPTLLFHMTMKECNRLREKGWDEVLMNLQHRGTELIVRFSGIKKE
jgi:hypothetical protein